MKILDRLQIILLFLFSFILVGATSIITGEMGWNSFKDPWFYTEQLTTDVAIICVTLATVYSYIEWFKETDPEYIACITFINNFAKGPNNIPSVILRFLNPFNRKRKIAQYKYNISIKISSLDYLVLNFYFFKIKTKRLRFKEEEMHLWNVGTEEQKANSKYCRKRKMYEEQLQDSLIEKNIDTAVVKYDRVTIGTLLSEYYTDEEGKGPNDFIEKRENVQILKYRLPKLFFSFGFTFILTSIIFGPAVVNTNGLIKLTVKIFTLLFNMWSSTLYAKKYVQKTTLHDVRFRKGVLMEYEKWLKQEAFGEPKPEPLKLTTTSIKEETLNG